MLKGLFLDTSPLFKKGPDRQKHWYFVPDSNYKLLSIEVACNGKQKPNPASQLILAKIPLFLSALNWNFIYLPDLPPHVMILIH